MLARDAYTYLHALFVAGIILSAVGDELVIAHPLEVLPPYEVAAVAAGPTVYLLAHALFRYRLVGSPGRRKLLGTLACAAAGLLLPAIALAALLILVLVAVAAADHIVAARRRARGEPSPLERLRTGPARG